MSKVFPNVAKGGKEEVSAILEEADKDCVREFGPHYVINQAGYLVTDRLGPELYERFIQRLRYTQAQFERVCFTAIAEKKPGIHITKRYVTAIVRRDDNHRDPVELANAVLTRLLKEEGQEDNGMAYENGDQVLAYRPCRVRDISAVACRREPPWG